VDPKFKNVKVNKTFETTVEGIYAAGDIIGRPALVCTGVVQAQAAVCAMFDEPADQKIDDFPLAMWTTPECAYFGLTVEAAAKKEIDAEEGVAQYHQCLRGRVFAPSGLLKLVFRKDHGLIIGVHIVGSDACELVHYGMSLVKEKVTIFSVITTIFTAVTFHELFKEAASNGNSKLKYGLEWHAILKELGVALGHLSPENRLEALKKEFESFDTSGDGALDVDELLAVFKNLGLEPKKVTVANLVRLADTDGSGTIEWNEFEQIAKRVDATLVAPA
jgi:Ca2+-binding EF-hand superfamily protein